jgi:hypothetical protein
VYGKPENLVRCHVWKNSMYVRSEGGGEGLDKWFSPRPCKHSLMVSIDGLVPAPFPTSTPQEFVKFSAFSPLTDGPSFWRLFNIL